LKIAETQLSLARSELAAFVNKHLRWTPAGHVYVAGNGREQLDGELKLRMNLYDEKLTKFHSALETWARYKT